MDGCIVGVCVGLLLVFGLALLIWRRPYVADPKNVAIFGDVLRRHRVELGVRCVVIAILLLIPCKQPDLRKYVDDTFKLGWVAWLLLGIAGGLCVTGAVESVNYVIVKLLTNGPSLIKKWAPIQRILSISIEKELDGELRQRSSDIGAIHGDRRCNKVFETRRLECARRAKSHVVLDEVVFDQKVYHLARWRGLSSMESDCANPNVFDQCQCVDPAIGRLVPWAGLELRKVPSNPNYPFLKRAIDNPVTRASVL